MKNIHVFFWLLSLFSCFTFAYTKTNNATDWPLLMNSNKSFDVASKCEMLVFIEVFNSYEELSKSKILQRIKLKKINEQSINRWKKETKQRILTNFNSLSKNALLDLVPVKKESSWEELSSIQLSKKLPANFSKWYKKTVSFYSNYIKEQIRLAALHPSITSEILQFSKSEIQGHNFNDKNFLLTFDDGPTKVNGNTDKLIKVLDDYKLTGMFFVLGDNLKKRLTASSKNSIRQLYGKNSVLSHGKTHKPHQKYTKWKESIDYTNKLINENFSSQNKLVYFRPPYGQRNKKIVNYFTSKKSKIILWNIDSRDWSSKLDVKQVANRQIKLMLLWRKGILLFHDIHSKAQKVTPIIYLYFKDSGITWMKSNDI